MQPGVLPARGLSATSRLPPRIIFLWLVCLAALAACSTVPITGRSQLRFISNAELRDQSDLAALAVIDKARASGMLLSRDNPGATPTLMKVSRVGAAISKAATELAADNPDIQLPSAWETYVIRNVAINAQVFVSGKIVIYDGLLEVANTEAMLAAVIGHEMGHVIAQHNAERKSQRLLADVGVRVAILAAAASKPRYAPLAATIAPVVATYGFLLPFNREHELEADRIGMTLMAKAGYDPSAAVQFWENMASRGEPRKAEFLSTHPTAATRRDDLQQWLLVAMKDFRPSRALANESLRSFGHATFFGGSDVWWKEVTAISDARVGGVISEAEAVILKQDLMSRTVDFSYTALHGLWLRDAAAQHGEFWDKVLEIQQRRNAGTMAAWEAEAQIDRLVSQRATSNR
jgi:metalloendopeptidase OMA1, mitochondrial